jgi:hypothetical protein
MKAPRRPHPATPSKLPHQQTGASRPAERVLAEFPDLYQIGYSRLRVRIVQSGASSEPRLDIRVYIESPLFTGFTRRGLRLDTKTLDRLREMLPAIAQKLHAKPPGRRSKRPTRGEPR